MERIKVTQIIILAEKRDAQGTVTGQVHRTVRTDLTSLPGLLKEAVKLSEQYLLYSESNAAGEKKAEP